MIHYFDTTNKKLSYLLQMGKPDTYLAKKIWPTERKLINKIITKQKGYHTKPYPSPNKIPTAALHSVKGALKVLDQAEKKKPNKGHILKYRRAFEHQNALPEAHYMAFKKTSSKSKKPQKVKLSAKEKEDKREAELRKDPTYQLSSHTLKRLAEEKLRDQDPEAWYAARRAANEARMKKSSFISPAEADRMDSRNFNQIVQNIRVSKLKDNPIFGRK